MIFTGCFGGLWWRLGAGPDQSRCRDALAGSSDSRTNIGHGNTVESAARRSSAPGGFECRPHPRYRGAGPRPAPSSPRAEGRGEAFRHRAADGAAARREPQSGRRRTRGSYHAGWPGRRCPPATPPSRSRRVSRRNGTPGMAPTFPRQIPVTPPPGILRHPHPAPHPRPQGAAAAFPIRAERTARRPRLARQPEPDRARRAEFNEIGLKNGNLIVDDQQRGNKWTFENISLSCAVRAAAGSRSVLVRRARARGRSVSWSGRRQRGAIGRSSRRQGADGQHPAGDAGEGSDLQRGPAADRRTERRIRPRRPADLFPRQGQGRRRTLIDSDTPDYPMPIDSGRGQCRNGNSGRRVLVAPFKVVSGSNRITLLAHLEPPNGVPPIGNGDLSGGTIVLAGPTTNRR